MAQPSVAIVILNFNGKKFLEKFLSSVIASTYSNKKIIIADNASSDGSVSFIQKNYPQVQLMLLQRNYGFAEGYNQALKKVAADYYVLLNSDVEVTPAWIEPVITLMENDHAIAACQPKLLSYYQKDLFEYAGAAGGWIDLLGYPFARGRVFETVEKDTLQYNAVQQIFWATGAAMFVRAQTYHQLSGFDGHFFAHSEEIDLCWRMQLAGHKIICCPRSVVYHIGGGTLPKGHRKTFLNFRNNLIMLSKNLPLQEKLWKMPLRICLDAVFAWKCLLKGDADAFMAIIEAHGALLKWCLRKKNKIRFPKKPMASLAGVYPRSLVFSYFIKKKKHFSEIVDNNI